MSSPRESSMLGLMLVGLTAIGSIVAAPLAVLSLTGKSERQVSQSEETESPQESSQNASQAESKPRLLLGSEHPANADSKQKLLGNIVGATLAGQIDNGDAEATEKLKRHFVVDGLVATIPDPLDSSNGYWFDLQIATLRRAAATHGYSLDRFDLPWQLVGKGSKSSSDSEKNLYRREPGLLVFRRNWKEKDKVRTELLLLYLVGETSTAGIHQAAFQKAVTHLLKWRTSSDPSHRIRVLGSVFTGSANSLASAIESFGKNPVGSSATSVDEKETKFRVVCGSANGVDWPLFEKRANHRAEVHSTRPKASALREELLKFVQEQDLSQHPARIAWLVESSSFGKASKQKPNEPSKAQDHPPKSQENSAPEVVEFAFPFHVSQVQNALKAQQSGDSKKKLPAFAPADSKLDISKSEAASPQDVIPTFSPITPALEELQLRQTMNTIQRDGFRYVGITATDPLDSAFLAELVRSHCPDVQLLFVSGATSFLHPKQRGFLKGALLATGYPLHHETQHWAFPWGADSDPERNTQWMFASDKDSTTGIYNAAVMLLASDQESRWKGKTFLFSLPNEDAPPLQLVDYGSPFVKSTDKRYRPPVWISAVGQGELIPVKVSERCRAEDLYLVEVEVSESVPTRSIYRTPSLTFPFSGAFLIVILVVLSVLAKLVSNEFCVTTPQPAAGSHTCPLMLGREARECRVPDCTQQARCETPGCELPRGWWPTLIDTIGPMLHWRQDQPGEFLLSPKAKQLIALLISSVAMLGLCVWISWVCGAVCWYEWETDNPLRSWMWLVGLCVVLLPFVVSFVIRVSASWRPRPLHPARVELSSPAGAMLLVSAVVLAFAVWAYGFPIGLKQDLLWNGWGFFWGSLAMAICGLFWCRFSWRLTAELRHTNSRWFAKFLVHLVFWGAILCVVLSIWRADNSASASVIRFLQTMSLTNGVSLIPPTVCLLISLCLWSGFVMRRLWLAESSQHDLPPWNPRHEIDQTPFLAVSNRMAETVDFLQELLRTGCHALRRNFTAQFFLVVGAGGLWLAHVSRWSAVAFDTREVAWIVWGVGGVAMLAWLHTFWQAIVLRRMIHKLLRQIAWLPPLTNAMARLPERVRVVVGHFLDIRQRRPSYLRVRVHYASYLMKTPPDFDVSNSNADELTAFWESVVRTPAFQNFEATFVRELNLAPAAIGHHCAHAGSPMHETVSGLRVFGQTIWLGLLEEWHRQPPSDVFPKSDKGRDEISKAIKQLAAELKQCQSSAARSGDQSQRSIAGESLVNVTTKEETIASPEVVVSTVVTSVERQELPRVSQEADDSKISKDDWINAAEELVATQVVNYLRGVLSFFYGQILFLLGMTVLFMLAMMLWPLQPQRQLMGTAVAMLTAVTAFCVTALFALERDRVHSILRGTTPDRIDFDRGVLLKLFVAVGPAVLMVVSYVFPDTVQWLFSFLEPLSAGQ